jgi:predicted phage terminase large subunit-like protein
MSDYPVPDKAYLKAKLDARAIELRIEDKIHRAQNGLLNFTLYTKPNYEINWHHRALARKLNDFANGKIKRLMVFMPPRNGKSELVSRRLPAYLLGKNPDCSIISTSYSADLASRMNRDVQRIIQSKEYTELFPATRLNNNRVTTRDPVASLQNTEIFEVVGRAGTYRSAGIRGGITGLGANFVIIDDPIKNEEEAASPTIREKIWQEYSSTIYTRLEKDAGILVTMTRWHEDDLAGRLLDQIKNDPAADEWEVVNFPAICEGVSNELDPREIGEALWPNKYPLKRLEGIKSTVGSKTWTALYQQRPAPEEGNVIRQEWWKEYTERPTSFDCQIQSWDLTFTGGKTSDWVVGQVWGKKGADLYLLDQVRRRMTFTETLDAFVAFSAKWPNATAKYVEEAANGYALIDSLKKKISGIIGVKPKSSKVARANAIAPRVEAGNVHLPHPKLASWIPDYKAEWASFPNGVNDDQVDATTQAIQKLGEAASTDWMPISLTGMNKFG